MAIITIGTGATYKNTSRSANYTYVSVGGAANDSGTITSIEIYASGNLVNCKVGIFYVVSGNYLSTRSTVTIGAVTAGSKQTFTEDSGSNPISMEVQTGDYIGIVFTSGGIGGLYSGQSGVWWKSGDYIPASNDEFNLESGQDLALYGTGIAPTFNYFGYNLS